ncbi:hypothetical protein C8Q73DRAFT_219299 [Cubamyces lactineus]|nr:hypothetical protein C8Q73DRAFT_219299 [Cubamyces lactineus]
MALEEERAGHRPADHRRGDSKCIAIGTYPTKLAIWLFVIDESKTRKLLAIKQVTVHRSLAVCLEFLLPQSQNAVQLYVIRDSYMGAGHDIDSLDLIDVAEGEEESDEGAVE